MSFPIRSPRETVGGVYIFGRILDKIRLKAKGELPEGYHVGIIEGKRTFDDRVCHLFGITFEALEAHTLLGGTDEEVLAWCRENGSPPDQESIAVWNGFMSKRGWNDEASSGLQIQKQLAGLGERADIFTFFDLMDAEERPDA
jgi:Domain of unknown function (DUF5069)